MHSYFSNLGWLGTAMWASAIHIIPLLFIPIAKKSGVGMSIYLLWFMAGSVLSLILAHAGLWLIPTKTAGVSEIFTSPPPSLIFGAIGLGVAIGGSYLLLLIQSAEKAAVVGANPILSFIIMAGGLIVAYLILGSLYGFSIKFIFGTVLVLAGGYLIKSSLPF